RPQKAAAFQPLREQACPLPVVPDHLDQIASPATEAKQMPTQRIAAQHLLHLQSQRREALAHVGVTGRQPYAHTRRECNHARLSAETMRATRAASAEPSTRTRSPLLSSISMVVEPRGTFRRRAGRTSSLASAVADCVFRRSRPPILVESGRAFC